MVPNNTPGRIPGRAVRLRLPAGLVRYTLASMVRQERADPVALRACAIAIGGAHDSRRWREVVEVTVGAHDLEGLLERVRRLDAWARSGGTTPEVADLIRDDVAACPVAPLDVIVLAHLAAEWGVAEETATAAVLWAAGAALMAKRLPGVDVGAALSVARRTYRRHDVPVAALNDLWRVADQYTVWADDATFDKASQAIGRAYVADTGPVVTIRMTDPTIGQYHPQYRTARVWPDPTLVRADDVLRAAVPDRIDARAVVQGAIGWKAARTLAGATAAAKAVAS